MSADQRSESAEEEIYWNLVESFIEAANTACDEVDPGVVSSAMLNAAARFNAFVVAHASIDRKEFTADIDDSIHYLAGRYREFLKGHMEDYREHYKIYIRPEESPEED